MSERPLVIPYTQWSGAGNTFLFVAADALGRLAHDPRGIARLARRMCRHPEGPGADGLAVIEGSAARIYNPDGSEAAFCGNGARCFVAHLLGATGQPRVSARIGGVVVEGWGEAERIAITVPPPRLLAADLPRTLIEPLPPGWPGTLARLAWIDAGVPHLCLHFLEPEGPEAAPPPEGALVVLGSRLRRHARFGPGGTNVDFLWNSAAGPAPRAWGPRVAGRLWTYERGVEGLTRACGSGALAAAALLLAGEVSRAALLTVSSGDRLEVEKGAPCWVLRGPAAALQQGELHLEAEAGA